VRVCQREREREREREAEAVRSGYAALREACAIGTLHILYGIKNTRDGFVSRGYLSLSGGGGGFRFFPTLLTVGPQLPTYLEEAYRSRGSSSRARR
jgi:hypothetical protein